MLSIKSIKLKQLFVYWAKKTDAWYNFREFAWQNNEGLSPYDYELTREAFGRHILGQTIVTDVLPDWLAAQALQDLLLATEYKAVFA